MPVALITFELNGVPWSRYQNQWIEWYSYIDKFGHEWKLWRKKTDKRPDLQEAWNAMIMWDDPNEGYMQKELNTGYMSGPNLDTKGVLFHLGAHDPILLLEGMSRLILEARDGSAEGESGIDRGDDPSESLDGLCD